MSAASFDLGARFAHIEEQLAELIASVTRLVADAAARDELGAFTVAQLCEEMSFDRDFVYDRIRAGEIPAFKVGTTYRIPKAWAREQCATRQAA